MWDLFIIKEPEDERDGVCIVQYYIYSVFLSSNKINYCKKHNIQINNNLNNKKQNITMHQNVTICANMPISNTACG